MSIEKRIEELEKSTGTRKSQVVVTVRYEGDDTQPSEEAFDQAVEAFIKKNGEQDIMVLHWKDGQFEAPHTLYNKRDSKIKSRPFGR